MLEFKKSRLALRFRFPGIADEHPSLSRYSGGWVICICSTRHAASPCCSFGYRFCWLSLLYCSRTLVCYWFSGIDVMSAGLLNLLPAVWALVMVLVLLYWLTAGGVVWQLDFGLLLVLFHWDYWWTPQWIPFVVMPYALLTAALMIPLGLLMDTAMLYDSTGG